MDLLFQILAHVFYHWSESRAAQVDIVEITNNDIRPIISLADKYDLISVLKMIMASQQITWFSLVLGLVTKDVGYCRDALKRGEMDRPSVWSRNQARAIGVDAYWAFRKVNDSHTTWRGMVDSVDWKQAMGE
jgi:hypothetical protein